MVVYVSLESVHAVNVTEFQLRLMIYQKYSDSDLDFEISCGADGSREPFFYKKVPENAILTCIS